MEPKDTQDHEPPRQQPISIRAVIDVVGALATGSLSGNLYLLDTNRANGSTGIGTESLRTRVRKGDQVLWTALPLECEAFASIEDIVVDKEFCMVESRTYPGTDVSYWIGTVKRDTEIATYYIKFKLGTRMEAMTTASPAFLVGAAT